MNFLSDPGLQAQRTALAWKRTGLAMLVNAGLVMKAGGQQQQAVLLGSLLLAMAVLATWYGHRRQQVLLGRRPAARLSPPDRPLQMLALALAALPLGWLGLVLHRAAAF